MPDVQYPDDPGSNPTIRIEEILATDQAQESTPPPREGLPRSFRMRADKHYVEMLDAPAQRGAAPATDTTKAATKAEKPAETSDQAAAAAGVQAASDLAQSLAALRACTSLLSDRGPLASTVAANVIRAEVWRSTCLLHMSRFLRGELAPAPKPVRADAVIDQVLKSIEPERRLRGVSIDQRVNLGDSRISVDEQLVVSTLSGLLMATISLSEEGADLLVNVSAESRGNDIVFGITQDLAGAPAYWAQSVAVVAATRIAAASDGRMTVKATMGGTDIRVTIPRLR